MKNNPSTQITQHTGPNQLHGKNNNKTNSNNGMIRGYSNNSNNRKCTMHNSNRKDSNNTEMNRCLYFPILFLMLVQLPAFLMLLLMF